jgi:hypothetical protein
MVATLAEPAVAAPTERPVTGPAHQRGSVLVGMALPGTAPGPASTSLPGTRIERILSRVGITVIGTDDVAATVAAYRRLPGIRFAEPDRLVRAASAPNDPIYGRQWNLAPVSATDAGTADWEPVFPRVQGAGALVAVVDSGYHTGGTDQPAHLRMDLARNMIDGSASVDDNFGHGTFVSNIIAAATNNGVAAASVAPQAQIVPVKVLDATGTAPLSTVAAGIDYAVRIGAKVINLSLAAGSDDDATDPGDTGDAVAPDPALCAAVQAAAASSVVVAATGNDSQRPGPGDATPPDIDPVTDPADCPAALAVGGLTADGSIGSYSNAGCPVAVVAPGGGDQLAVDPGAGVIEQGWDTDPASPTFGTFQDISEAGTSMAAAHVSGEAALLVGLGADVPTARRAIVSTARPLNGPGRDPTFGEGAIDIAAAVAAVTARRVPLPTARGYRMVEASGAVSAFGDPCYAEGFQGQIAGRLARPIVGMAATPTGRGYWLVASDGGVFAFGAPFLGSLGGVALSAPIAAVTPSAEGVGYYLLGGDSAIYAFGSARYLGAPSSFRAPYLYRGGAP